MTVNRLIWIAEAGSALERSGVFLPFLDFGGKEEYGVCF